MSAVEDAAKVLHRIGTFAPPSSSRFSVRAIIASSTSQMAAISHSRWARKALVPIGHADASAADQADADAVGRGRRLAPCRPGRRGQRGRPCTAAPVFRSHRGSPEGPRAAYTPGHGAVGVTRGSGRSGRSTRRGAGAGRRGGRASGGSHPSPAARHRSTSSAKACAVRPMMGVRAAPGAPRPGGCGAWPPAPPAPASAMSIRIRSHCGPSASSRPALHCQLSALRAPSVRAGAPPRGG